MTEELHSLSGAYVVNALSEQERRDFEGHLERCSTCREEVDSLREVTPLLAGTVAVAPPPSLRAAILAQARVTRQEPPLVDDEPDHVTTHHDETADDAGSTAADEDSDAPATVHTLRPRRRAQWTALAAAAALLVGGGVTWQVVDQVTTSASDEVLAAPDARTWETTTADGGTVMVTRSADMGQAVLRVEELSDPGEGKAYQAWLQDDEGAMIPAGMITSTDSEMVLDGDVDAATGVGVTTEPAAGSPAPTSDPIALIDFS